MVALSKQLALAALLFSTALAAPVSRFSAAGDSLEARSVVGARTLDKPELSIELSARRGQLPRKDIPGLPKGDRPDESPEPESDSDTENALHWQERFRVYRQRLEEIRTTLVNQGHPGAASMTDEQLYAWAQSRNAALDHAEDAANQQTQGQTPATGNQQPSQPPPPTTQGSGSGTSNRRSRSPPPPPRTQDRQERN